MVEENFKAKIKRHKIKKKVRVLMYELEQKVLDHWQKYKKPMSPSTLNSLGKGSYCGGSLNVPKYVYQMGNFNESARER